MVSLSRGSLTSHNASARRREDSTCGSGWTAAEFTSVCPGIEVPCRTSIYRFSGEINENPHMQIRWSRVRVPSVPRQRPFSRLAAASRRLVAAFDGAVQQLGYLHVHRPRLM